VEVHQCEGATVRDPNGAFVIAFAQSDRVGRAIQSIVLSLVAIAAPDDLPSQRLVRINEQASCPSCEIVLDRGPRLGEADGPGALVAEPSSLASDSRGRFYLTEFTTAQPPLVFDSQGRFLRELGRLGPGPGEFLMARYLVVGESDSVYVTDAQAGRLSVFTPQLVLARSASDVGVARAMSFEVLRDGSIGVATDVLTRERIGFPLHLYKPGLEFLKSFGADTPAFDPRHPLLSRRRLSRSRDGGLWSARATEYVIDRFDSNGIKTLRLVRQAPWFPPHLGPTLSEDPEPKPRVMAISEDSHGRLWVLTVVKDDRWKAALGYNLPTRLGGGRSPMPVIVDEDRYFDTIIDVIDVEKGKLVVTRRVPQAIPLIVDEKHIAKRIEDPSGAYYMQLWTVSVRDTARHPTPKQGGKI
jgi:6-bladed beta-propeller